MISINGVAVDRADDDGVTVDGTDDGVAVDGTDDGVTVDGTDDDGLTLGTSVGGAVGSGVGASVGDKLEVILVAIVDGEAVTTADGLKLGKAEGAMVSH